MLPTNSPFYARGGYYDNKTRRPYEAYDYNILHETFNYGIGTQYMISKGNYITADYYADHFSSSYCFF